ncbi:polysaccharide biosynthesis tyrosine autokinase [Bifidobacterium gallicum]|uniref:non-specific protein-tyrosine kinase n=1 Tax=Bifidobacterium gallicum DSM 20093 = LMG 11596 TaxID=561180 RepID=D1NRS1_9BIFI|nr:polysaccharide biosynthesis tyrosine autokinase [Bifidobacterium gallicum]EFA23910.1 chain length determinant protein [Bifidobacterium gallicum DSM 20093 = LMG 11596]KFI59112.1 Etk tyrosine kinase [Bifidobacterium gallicum DSM 20093 = LMG 11596]
MVSQTSNNVISTPTEGERQESNLTLAGLFHIIMKHVIAAIVTFVIIVACACFYLVLKAPVYSATAQTFATYSEDSATTDNNYSNLGNAASYINTQVKSYPALVATDVVLQPVINELHLNESVNALASTINAVNPANTAFINISVTSSDPQMAQIIANAVAQSFQEVVKGSLYTDGTVSPVKITIVKKATVPTAPSEPKKTLVLLVGIAGGLVAGIFAALLRDMFTRKIQDERELSEYLGAPTLGRIPEEDVIDGKSSVIISSPSSSVAESYRRICTNLSFVTPVYGTKSRLIVISSAGPGEGKTTTAANIATALVENGASVLLIDAGLRHPSVAHKLHIDGETGLAHVLSGQASVKDVIQPFWRPNLHVMPAGPKPPNPAQLLNSPLMRELLAQALHQYDFVVVDTAPMVVANDAALFAKQGGGLVVVARRGMTLKKQLVAMATEVKNLDVTVTGFVFNSAKNDKSSLAGSNYYYYYGSGDGSSEKRRKSNHKA